MSTARAAVDRSLTAIAADGRPGIWIALTDPDVVLAAAASVDRRVALREALPLAGRTLAVKDNIDVAGLPTTAACPAYRYDPATSAPAVQALVDAGAVVMGKTNMDQFATGLVGTRSPHGACPNALWDHLVSGGSSSGSAVAVACGMVDLALGTDTAGSGRVPAAANGIVGVKPTRGLISTVGAVPACASLDCVSVFARSVDDAVAVARLAAATPIETGDPWRRVGGRSVEFVASDGSLRLGVPAVAGLDFDGDPAGPDRFATAVEALVATAPGSALVDVDLAPFSAAAALLYGGAFVAERYAAVGPFIAAHPGEIEPVVETIVLDAAERRAWELFDDQAELRRHDQATRATWDVIDLLVVPSVPRVPTRSELAADPIGTNAMLGTYTNFVNLLDLAAVTFPVRTRGADPAQLTGPPQSLTLVGPAGTDDLLADVARRLA